MTDTIMQGVPGLKFENGQNGSGQESSMQQPPHLAPINTGNNNSMLGAIGSPPPGTIASPTSAGGSVRRSAPEPNKNALYIGGLDPRVNEDTLRQIFQTAGNVINVKIIPDKNMQNKGFNYGFIEYENAESAERAMATLNGRSVLQHEIRVNWAYQSNSQRKEDTTNHYHIFVGDLSNEVNDEILLKAFSAFGTVSEARVMWDMKTGRSRGYGFVAFRDKTEAEKALSAMDGEWLGSRQIRCNWANQKGQPSFFPNQTQQPPQMQAMTPAAALSPVSRFGPYAQPTQGSLNYQTVLAQAPQWQTTVYVGNLTPYTTQNDLLPVFQMFGYVVEARFQSDRGFAFIKMDTHEHATNAICQINGYNVHGRPLKCSWGKDKNGTGAVEGYSPQNPGFAQSPPGYFPQYNASAMSPTAQTPFSAHSAGSPAYPQSPANYGQSATGYGQSPAGYAQSPGGAYGQQQHFSHGFGRNNQYGSQAAPGAAYGGSFQAGQYHG